MGAGISKLLEPPAEFIAVVRAWDILGDPWLSWYAELLPWVEAGAGVLLLLGLYQRLAGTVIGVSLMSFLIAIVINVARDRTLADCGCFGQAWQFGTSWSELWWRDIVLLVLAFVVIIKPSPVRSLDAWWQRKRN